MIVSSWNDSNDHPTILIKTLLLYNSLISQQLFPYQSSVGSALSTFKNSVSTLVTPLIAVPLSPLEQYSGITPSEVDASELLRDEFDIVKATTVGIIEPTINLYENHSEFKSKPLVVTISRPWIALSTLNITITLANTVPHALTQSDYNFSTICHRREIPPLIRTYVCPFSGFVIVHNAAAKSES